LHSESKAVVAAKGADSFTINPSDWYGLGSAAVCVCHDCWLIDGSGNVGQRLTMASIQTFFTSGIPTGLPQDEEAMLSLALWITMQYVGQELLSSIVKQAVTLVCTSNRASSSAQCLSQDCIYQANQLFEKISHDASIQLYSIHDSLSVVFRYG
jgi:hypothetical protein